MGAVPSREAPTSLYSLRYGNHEIGLIPFTKFFISPEFTELRRQLVRLRNDPGVRYNQFRPTGIPITEIPPPTYTEEKLDRTLDVVDASLFNTNEEMLSAFEHERIKESNLEKERVMKFLKRSTRPVPCVVIFIYSKGRDDVECFHYQGRRVNVIGYISCRSTDDECDDDIPFLELRKAMLKAAGDRTIERVLTLAATLYYEQLNKILRDHRPHFPQPFALLDHLKQMPIRIECMWNNYPILKLLFDSVALLNVTPEINVKECPPRVVVIPDAETASNSRVVEVTLPPQLVSRIWSYMSQHQLRVTNRSTWVQFVLANESHKSKRFIDLVNATPISQNFFGGKKITQMVREHLDELHKEIVAARSASQTDSTLWFPQLERSHDNKVYRIYNSSVCGPFLTTVKPVQKEDSNIIHEQVSDGLPKVVLHQSVASDLGRPLTSSYMTPSGTDSSLSAVNLTVSASTTVFSDGGRIPVLPGDNIQSAGSWIPSNASPSPPVAFSFPVQTAGASCHTNSITSYSQQASSTGCVPHTLAVSPAGYYSTPPSAAQRVDPARDSYQGMPHSNHAGYHRFLPSVGAGVQYVVNPDGRLYNGQPSQISKPPLFQNVPVQNSSTSPMYIMVPAPSIPLISLNNNQYNPAQQALQPVYEAPPPTSREQGYYIKQNEGAGCLFFVPTNNYPNHGMA